MSITAISDETEFNEALRKAGNHLVVVDFYATWCGPCKLIAPQLASLAEQNPDVVFLKVDVDEAEDLAANYEITGLPTIVFLKNEKKLDLVIGSNMDKIKSSLASLK